MQNEKKFKMKSRERMKRRKIENLKDNNRSFDDTLYSKCLLTEAFVFLYMKISVSIVKNPKIQ